MKDVRGLVPRTPPEGLKHWVLNTRAAALERSGLIYEAEYVKDWGFGCLLDEWAKPRKTKMVRVTCSCCGDSMLLHWAPDHKRGYGFILPEDVEGEWDAAVMAAGDECRCPMCNTKVLVNKRAAVRDYYVTAETTCMSAALVGEERLLALTGWTVQARTHKSGCFRLEIIPAEAYVFSSDTCVQLLGWRRGYSGTAGYFVQYRRAWSQPARWTDGWGGETAIFGLTPELVAASCLPHCKLDVYMEHLRGTSRRYPVAYLRLYQQHPNVEVLLTRGLPLVLDDMIQEKMEGKMDLPKFGIVALEEIDWKETRPAHMLGLTRDELRMARSQGWGLLFWRLFSRTKAAGETLAGADIQAAFLLGKGNVLELIGRGPVGKSIRYLPTARGRRRSRPLRRSGWRGSRAAASGIRRAGRSCPRSGKERRRDENSKTRRALPLLRGAHPGGPAPMEAAAAQLHSGGPVADGRGQRPGRGGGAVPAGGIGGGRPRPETGCHGGHILRGGGEAGGHSAAEGLSGGSWPRMP